MESKLKVQAIKGIKWTSINTIITAFSSPLFQIILAILLTPTEFAYIAVISLFVGITELLSEVGIGEALIQKDKINTNEISSLFFLNVIISIILVSILFIVSPLIEDFYSQDHLGILLQLVCIVIPINGITSIFKVYIQRVLLFKI